MEKFQFKNEIASNEVIAKVRSFRIFFLLFFPEVFDINGNALYIVPIQPILKTIKEQFMKKFLFLAAFVTAAVLQSATFFPNGDLSITKGYTPDVRTFKGKAKFQRLKNALLLETFSQDASIEINFHKLPTPEAGKTIYVRVPFEILELGEAPVRKVAGRIFFYDKNGKHLPKLNFFAPEMFPGEGGKQDFFYSVKVPAGAAKYSFTFWFAGIKKLRIDKFTGSLEFPTDSADGNLILNGGFETANMASFYPRLISKTAPVRIFERTTDKAKSGRWSLRMRCDDPKKSLELNFTKLAHTPGKKYRFTGSYFLASREGKSTLTGRVMFLDSKGKVIRYLFPAFQDVVGVWQQIDLSFFPPTNCTKVVVTLWYTGKQVVYLDDFYYGAIEEKSPANQNASVLKLSENADCTLWKQSGYLKVPATDVPAGIKSASVVEVAAAANESEPFQVVVTAKKKLSDVTLAFSPLKGKKGVIPATALSFRRVGFVNLKNPDNPTLKGLNADPLLPEKSAEATPAQNLPFFVRVNVPAGSGAGFYEGEVKVLSGTRLLGKFILKLRVFDFEIPTTPHLKSYFYLQPTPGYNVWDKRPHAQKIENFHRLLQDHRMTGNQALWTPVPQWKIEKGNLIITDWRKFDEHVALRVNKYGQRSLPVPLLSMKGDNDGWFNKANRDKPGNSPFGKFNLISPEGLKYIGQYAAAFCAHVKEKFPGIDFYAYLYDEPPAKVHADLKILLDSIHKAAPELKIMIPKLVTDQIGYVHTFCVPLAPGYFHADQQEAHLKKGGALWYYNWPARLSNHDYIHNRLYAWKIYSGKGSGGLLWCTNWTYKDVNPWTDFDRTGYGSGGATIFYPPRKAGEGNVPSQRAAMIRESMDDFDYMRILEKLIDKSYPGVGRTRVMEHIKSLIPQPPFEFVNDPHLLYQIRQEIAEDIENFKKFPGTVVSLPSCNSKVELSQVTFKVYAPAGTAVKINGKAAGIVKKNLLEVPYNLSKLGVNKVQIDLVSGKNRLTLFRTYELAADPRLKELAALVERAAKEGIDVKAAQSFLGTVNKGGAYTGKERTQARKFVESFKYILASKALNAKRSFVNDLEKFFFERARQVFSWKLFERSEYYLRLAGDAAKIGNMKNFKVKVTPVVFKGHPALCFDNGIIQATILETGATVLSFKVKGVETFVPGPLGNLLPPEKRAAQKVTQDMFTSLGGYDGFTDAGGGGVWPIAFVDWDITIRQLTSERASLTFAAKIPGTTFMLKRTMSLKSGSTDLVMDYEITNFMPPESASDDPEHLQLPWRGRFVPGIGSGAIPQTDDRLVVPVKYDRDKLEQSLFRPDKPLFFERRSVRMTRPVMGAYDTVLQKGIAIIGSPVTTHSYVWFNSKGNHEGGGKVYTLEFCRSFFGKKYDDAEPNRPLTIHPGKTLNFSITLRGLPHVKNDAEFLKQSEL